MVIRNFTGVSIILPKGYRDINREELKTRETMCVWEGGGDMPCVGVGRGGDMPCPC